jgi:hypothetical protein
MTRSPSDDDLGDGHDLDDGQFDDEKPDENWPVPIACTWGTPGWCGMVHHRPTPPLLLHHPPRHHQDRDLRPLRRTCLDLPLPLPRQPGPPDLPSPRPPG